MIAAPLCRGGAFFFTLVSTRWGWIKKEFTKEWLAVGGAEQKVGRGRRRERGRGIWQRRFCRTELVHARPRVSGDPGLNFSHLRLAPDTAFVFTEASFVHAL
jgi:hypothetical protein